MPKKKPSTRKNQDALLLKNLNARRRSLMKRGASPKEIDYFFGVPFNTKFGKLDSGSLRAVADNVAQFGSVKVIRGQIYPEKYIRSHDIWFGKGQRPLLQAERSKTALEKAMGTTFMTEDLTLESTKYRKYKFDRVYVERIANEMRFIGLENIASKILKMTAKQVKRFVDYGMGSVDTGKFFYLAQNSSQYDSTSADEEWAESVLTARDRISNLWTQYRKVDSSSDSG